MSIKIRSFGGIGIWYMRKYFSNYTSKIVLEFASKKYAKIIEEYIQHFIKDDMTPIFKMVNIETINRCNGTCAFCPANVRDERRPLKKMSQELFEKIVEELEKLSWGG